jgi:TonB family protein
VGRYLTWSLAFHLAVLGSGALLAPLGGLFGSTYKPTQIISVGLVDFPDPPKSEPVAVPQPPVPSPAGDEAIALAPESDLTLENIPEEQPEPEPVEVETEAEAGSEEEEDSTLLAQADAESDVSHTLTEGPAEGDMWGVETPANVNPYHRRGFALIRDNWRNPVVGPTGRKCMVRFRILRSGELTDIELEQSSGAQIFDQAALRAVRYAKTWDAFPTFWEENEQIIHLEFEYRP